MKKQRIMMLKVIYKNIRIRSEINIINYLRIFLEGLYDSNENLPNNGLFESFR